MLLIDFSQISIANLMASLGKFTNTPIETDLVRNMILNSLRANIVKFKNTYGQIIICCDDTNFWRKDYFPYYKSNRKEERAKSDLDWNSVFKALNTIRDELKENFPYAVVQVARCEADDIFGTLIHRNIGKTFGQQDRTLILSGDHDFAQLQIYSNIEQYDPVQKKWIKELNAEKYLKLQIMGGDKGDGVPNFLSQDDSFVMKVRQKTMTQKIITKYSMMEFEDFEDESLKIRYGRNKQMIDLSCVPLSFQENILKEYEASLERMPKDRSKLFNYFLKHKMKKMTELIGDF